MLAQFTQKKLIWEQKILYHRNEFIYLTVTVVQTNL